LISIKTNPDPKLPIFEVITEIVVGCFNQKRNLSDHDFIIKSPYIAIICANANAYRSLMSLTRRLTGKKDNIQQIEAKLKLIRCKLAIEAATP
jgi:hypothetical protein